MRYECGKVAGGEIVQLTLQVGSGGLRTSADGHGATVKVVRRRARLKDVGSVVLKADEDISKQ